jgi:hypothetical protein
VAALAEDLRELAADTGPSEHHCQTVSVKRDWPAASTVIRNAPWGVMIDAARYVLVMGVVIRRENALRAGVDGPVGFAGSSVECGGEPLDDRR